jgi:transposase
METIAKIRRRHLVNGESISAIARDLNLSRPTVRKYIQANIDPVYQRSIQPQPRLSDYRTQLEAWLATERHLPKAQRRTARRMFECLQVEGYRGAYDSVQRYIRQWKTTQTGNTIKQAFIPMAFAPGEVCQFDWSHEQVELGGVVQTIKLAHFRLTYSRKMFVAAYPRETQEMVFDAHNRAFAFFGGVTQRMVYDNLKAVVDAILVGKERRFNRRFMALANHYLFEPVACTPASGWEKGQVENQVGNIREWLFTPRPRFAGFAELNDWLAQRCQELSARKHPTASGQTIAEVFVLEQPMLRQIAASFDGYIEQMLRVSSTCLVSADRNRYSVPARFARQVVSVRTCADRVSIVANGEVIAEHVRHFGRDQLVCDTWHYLPVLAMKPGALRNGVPFQDLPPAIGVVRDKILKQPKGDRAFVELLLAAKEVGLEPLEVACELALEHGILTAAVVMNELRRLITPPQHAQINLPDQLQLQQEPLADCDRYDSLRGGQYVH